MRRFHVIRLTMVVGALFALIAVVLALPVTAVSGDATITTVASGLDNPRGITFDAAGAMYVAEAGVGGESPCAMGAEGEVCYGTTGAITKVDDGVQSRIATGIGSLALAEGANATGPHDVAIDANGDLIAVTGMGFDPAVLDAAIGGLADQFGRLLTIPGDGTFMAGVDVAAHETNSDPDGEGVDSNPFNIIADGANLVAVDAGGNSIVTIANDGTISTLATLPTTMVEFPPNSGMMIPMQSVPTSIAKGPDGAYYVGLLTGFPFPNGGSDIYRIAMDGTTTVFATGFTNVIGVDFGPDGSLYVLEMFANSILSGDPMGALNRIFPNGTRQIVANNELITPSGLAVGPDGAVYVSNVSLAAGQGEVLRINPDQPTDVALRTITGGVATPLVSLFVIAFGLVVAATVLRARRQHA